MLGLASCGGSSSDNPPTETPEVKVSEIIVPTPRFSQTLKLTINGSALDQGITVVAPCATVTENPGGSATQRTYNCLVNAVGNNTVEVRNNAAASLSQTSNHCPTTASQNCHFTRRYRGGAQSSQNTHYSQQLYEIHQ